MSLDGKLGSLFDLIGAEAISAFLEQDLPVVGSALASLTETLGFGDFETEILDAINSIPDPNDPGVQADLIAAVLGAIDGVTASASMGVVTITVVQTVEESIEITSGSVDLDAGAAGFAAETTVDGTVGATLDIQLEYDFNDDSCTIIDRPGAEVALVAGLDAIYEVEAGLGPFGIEIEDTSAGNELEITADVNIAGSTPSDVSLTLGGTAGLDVRVRTGVLDTVLPSFYADLVIDYDIANPTDAPTIAIPEVGVDITTLAAQLAPLLDPVTEFLTEGPVGALVETLVTPIPIIDEAFDLLGLPDPIPFGGGALPAGDGTFNFLDALGIYFLANSQTDRVDALSLFAQVLGVLLQLAPPDGEDEVLINLGGFALGPDGTPGAFTAASISAQLQSSFFSGDNPFEQGVEIIEGILQGGTSAFSDTNIEDEEGVSFPIFEDPAQIVGLLFPGENDPATVTLIEYDIPALTGEILIGDFFIPFLGPLGLSLGGAIEATLDFKIGYDTTGFETGNFFDGIFIGTQELEEGERLRGQDPDIQYDFAPVVSTFVGARAALSLNAVLARVDVGGGILGFAGAFLPGGQLRLADLGGCIFDPVTGRIGAEIFAKFTFGLGPFSFSEEVVFADITLVDFTAGCQATLDPATGLATRELDGGATLLLNAGPLAFRRDIGGVAGVDGAEVFRVGRALDEEGAIKPGVLAVTFSSFIQEFGAPGDTPTRITGNLGFEDDILAVEPDLTQQITVDGLAGNDIIEGAAAGDQLSGNVGDDRLIGRAGNDTLSGGADDDFLDGGPGADLLDGGSGIDRVSYEGSPAGVRFIIAGISGVDVVFEGVSGDATGDRLISIENIIGSNFPDLLLGNPFVGSTLLGRDGDDTLVGGAGDDFLIGGVGADLLQGNAGRDGTAYVTSFGAVQIDLAAGTATGGEATGDVLVSIQDVLGSGYYDVLLGDNGPNALDGFLGDDLIDGRGGIDDLRGDAGEDTIRAFGEGASLDGGPDRDLLDFSLASGPIDASLDQGTAQRTGAVFADTIAFAQIIDAEGMAQTVDYSSFEDIEGSANNDTLEGDRLSNLISGKGGGDDLLGLGGNDTLIGGFGADDLDGGSGRDLADYSDGFAVNVSLATGSGLFSTAAGDTLSSIEDLRGTRANDTLTGDGGPNRIDPGLSSSTGFDTVNGGGGIDTLLIDYSQDDFGLGLTGGASSGFFVRLASTGLAVLDRVDFADFENYRVIGTRLGDFFDTGNGDDTLFTGGGGDIVNSGQGADFVSLQEGNDSLTYTLGPDLADQTLPDPRPFFLDGGRDTDILDIDLRRADEDIDISAGAGRVNFRLASGAAAVNFEQIGVVQTGSGQDTLQQFGRSSNEFDSRGDVDVLIPGLGIDTVMGGSDFGPAEFGATGGTAPGAAEGFFIVPDLGPVLDNIGDTLVLNFNASSAIFSQSTRAFSALVFEDGGGPSLVFTATEGRFESMNALDVVDFSEIERIDVLGSPFDDLLRGAWRGVSLNNDPQVGFDSAHGADTLRGNTGNDVLIANTGSDSVFGGEGADTLVGTDPLIDNGIPEGLPSEPRDIFEIDTLAGEAGGDLFVLGVAGDLVPMTTFRTPEPFYLGRDIAQSDAEDARAVIVDFTPGDGDQLQLAGVASDYTTEAFGGGLYILRAGGARDIVAELQGITSLDLTSDAILYVGANGPLGWDPTAPLSGLSGAMAALSSATLPTTVVPADAPPPEGAPALSAASSGSWVTQEANPAVLRNALLGPSPDPALRQGVVRLEGDARAFGVFQNDPFGLGSGVVLSTGQVEDLDGTNEIDGGFFTGEDLALDFELIGTFSNPLISNIYRAEIGNLIEPLRSFALRDDNDVLGGGFGGLSGLEIDALILSRTLLTANDLANGADFNDPAVLPRLDVLDYSAAGLRLTPGSQRSPVEPNLDNVFAETTAAGIATLGVSDYNDLAETGYFTLGDGGEIALELTAPVSTDVPLYVYVAEGGAAENFDVNFTASTARLDAPADLSTDFGAPGAEDDRIALVYEFFNEVSTPDQQFVAFEFLVFSEELIEFAGSEFSDIFRISLNGVQYGALSDGSALTVNSLRPAPFAQSNPDLILNLVGEGPVADHTRADAYTQVLSVVAPVRSGQNILRIEVEDVRDGLLDSGILVRGQTLGVATEPVIERPRLTIPTEPNGTLLAEGSSLAFTLTLEPGFTPLFPVDVTLTPDTMDVDLGAGPGQPVVQALGAGGAPFQVSALADGAFEGDEGAILSFSLESADPLYDGLEVAPVVLGITDGDLPLIDTGGPGNDTLEGTPGDDRLSGLGGQDTLRGLAGNDTLSGGPDADLLEGEAGDDLLEGEDGADTLEGGADADTLDGGPGGDTLDGGTGDDLATYRSASAGVRVNLVNPATNTGEAAGDSYVSVEGIEGSGLADTLIGSAAADLIRGGLGNDELRGQFGPDTIEGGLGDDTLFALIATNRSETEANLLDGEAGDDRLIGAAGPDTLRGGPGLDTLIGEAGDDFLDGGEDADTLDGGPGADLLSGAGGIDLVTYANAGAAVGANLTNPAANTGAAAGDTYNAVENIEATPFADTLTGSLDDNLLIGGAGNDALRGQFGADTLQGGLGNDTLFALVASNRSETEANSLEGGEGADLLIGAAGPDTLEGGPGNDRLQGEAGDDSLEGGPNNDTLDGGAGGDVLNGGSGTDLVSYQSEGAAIGANLVNPSNNTGAAAGDTYASIENVDATNFDDTLTGSTGANRLRGLDGNDELRGQFGPDTLIGGLGNDTLYALVASNRSETDANLLNGGAGDDLIVGAAGMDTLLGNIGLDTLRGEAGDDSLNGGGGPDLLDGGPGADVLNGGSARDIVSYLSAASGVGVNLVNASTNTGAAAGDSYISIEDVEGSAFGDVITGSTDANLIRGGAGGDELRGQFGSDTLEGGAGDDTLFALVASNRSETVANVLDGGNGDDLAIAAAGPDLLSGGAGNDTLSGEAGNDTLDGGTGFDSLDGGPGLDLATYANASAGISANLVNPATNAGEAAGDSYVSIENVDGSTFGDTITGSTGANLIRGGAGNDELRGQFGSDTLEGGAGNDSLFALVASNRSETAANLLRGGPGTDLLVGAAGSDTLEGGTGNDTLSGEGGADRFVFEAPGTAAGGIDTVLDFVPGLDTLALDDDGFTALQGVNFSAANLQSGFAQDADDFVLVFGSELFYDPDGNGPAPQIRFAVLNGGPTPTPADFDVF
ncbi:MAG: choice-of-anchor L domain-containing protein [Pseudomonadota bacterium]